jgi:hypothetical protein
MFPPKKKTYEILIKMNDNPNNELNKEQSTLTFDKDKEQSILTIEQLKEK